MTDNYTFKTLKTILKTMVSDYSRRENEENSDDMYNGRSLAIALVGIASCYLMVMICKAYHRMNS